MKSKKVILDTNLWISFLISKKFNSIDALINNGDILLIFSEELLEEFVTVTILGNVYNDSGVYCTIQKGINL
jgi:putative PIN family toxin of toxin-antitoxin system